MTWTLLARDKDREITGVLEGGSFTLSLRHNEVGSWQLTIPLEMTPQDWPHPGCGVIFLRDSKVVASGNMDEEAFLWDTDSDPRGTYTLSGDTDLGRIAYRVVYPSPQVGWTAQSIVKHYTTTDVASTVLRRLVDRNAILNALDYRRVPGLSLGSEGAALGPVITSRERFTPLLEALRSAAQAGGGLSFDIRDELNGNLEFYVTQPVDRTAVAQFGVEVGNVLSLDVRRSSPTATAVLLGGAESGTSRYKMERTNPPSTATWGRRELFLDQRQGGPDEMTDPGDQAEEDAKALEEYERAAAEALADNDEQTSVSAAIIDTPTTQWGRDFNLGDKVGVLTPFGQVADLVREVQITGSETGDEEIVSVIGSPNPSTEDPLAATVTKLTKRISQLERGL